MAGGYTKESAIKDAHSVEETREINEASCNVMEECGFSHMSEGSVPGFVKGKCIASQESGGKKSVKATKV
jgi:hypothetical protein